MCRVLVNLSNKLKALLELPSKQTPGSITCNAKTVQNSHFFQDQLHENVGVYIGKKEITKFVFVISICNLGGGGCIPNGSFILIWRGHNCDKKNKTTESASTQHGMNEASSRSTPEIAPYINAQFHMRCMPRFFD